MEALRTQLDNLQWEVNRLDAENRRLREQDPETTSRVDCETELERAKGDVTELSGRVDEYERRLAESAEALEDATRRASEAERRSTELADELQAWTGSGKRTPDAESEGEREEERAELEQALAESEKNTAAMRGEIAKLREELRVQKEPDREAVLQTELKCLHAVEEERRKWEERESRWNDKIMLVVEELRAAGRSGVPKEEVLELKKELEATKNRLNSAEAMVSGLSEANEQLRRENHTLLRKHDGRERQQRRTEGAPVTQDRMEGLRATRISEAPCSTRSPSNATSVPGIALATVNATWSPWIAGETAGGVDTGGLDSFSLWSSTRPTYVRLPRAPLMSVGTNKPPTTTLIDYS